MKNACLDGLARRHGAEEGRGVRQCHFPILQLLGTLVVLWLPLVVVLHTAKHRLLSKRRLKMVKLRKVGSKMFD
jgi:hypothetical protein